MSILKQTRKIGQNKNSKSTISETKNQILSWDDAFLSSSYGNWDALDKSKKGRGRPKKVK